jgi:hypothetical protein
LPRFEIAERFKIESGGSKVKRASGIAVNPGCNDVKVVAEKFRYGTIQEEMEVPGGAGLRWQLNQLIVYLKGKAIGCRRQIE